MKKFILITLIVFSMTVSSTTVILTSDKTELMVNESIKFHIEVCDWDSSAGGFTIMRETEVNRFMLVGSPHFTSSCSMCGGGRKFSELDEDYLFTPGEEGHYRAEAVYGRVQKKIDFMVYPPATTTSSTTSTSTTSTSTSSTSTSSTSSTSTSSTTSSTSTTIQQLREGGDLAPLYALGFILLLFVSALVYKRIRCS